MTNTTSAAVVETAHRARIAGQLNHAHEQTRNAALSLGVSGEDAIKAADDGGLFIDDRLITITPVPSSVLSGGKDDRLVISASTGCHLKNIETQELISILAQAPGLLACYGVTMGCSPDGEIMLHQIWHQSTSEGSLARQILVTHHLAQLIADQIQSTGAQQ